jgi:amino acid transporter
VHVYLNEVLALTISTQNFGVSFRYDIISRSSSSANWVTSYSVISVITGIPSLFLYGLVRSHSYFFALSNVSQTTGGPAVMVWGWIVVAVMTMLVGLAMAEVCSAHPTSGGPYFWYNYFYPRS